MEGNIRKYALLLGGFVVAVDLVLLGAMVQSVLVGLQVIQRIAAGLHFLGGVILGP